MTTYFDQVIVINLDTSTDRWQRVHRMLITEAGVPGSHVTRLSASDREMARRMVTQGAWKLPTAHVGRAGIDYRAQLGQLGCKLSHYRAVCMAKSRGWNRVLIMEDDAEIESMIRLNLAIHEMQSMECGEWDLMWFFGLYYETATGLSSEAPDGTISGTDRAAWIKQQMAALSNDPNTKTNDLVHRLKASCSTVCYGISADCYDAVLTAMEDQERYGALPVDDLYYRLHSRLRSYIVLPCPITTDLQNESTITGQSTETPIPQVSKDSTTQPALDLTPDMLTQQKVLSALALRARQLLRDHAPAPKVYHWWKTCVRPNTRTNDNRVVASCFPDELVIELIEFLEPGLDMVDYLDWLWNLHDVEGFDHVEKVADMLHVTAYYAHRVGIVDVGVEAVSLDALSVRTAALLAQRLHERGASRQDQEELAENAQWARRRWAEALGRVRPGGLGAKMHASGLYGYVINLDRRRDRWEQFEQQVVKAGLSGLDDAESDKGSVHSSDWWWHVTRFRAVDGRTLERTKPLEHLFRDNDFDFRRGTMGCALSHVGLWQQLLEDTTHDAYLIMEDDVQLLDGFASGEWLQQYRQLNMQHPSWTACFLSFIPSPEWKSGDCSSSLASPNQVRWAWTDPKQPRRLRRLTPDMTWGGFASYIINRRGAAILCNFIDQHGIQNGIDYLLMRKRDHPDLQGLENYLLLPNVCFAQWVDGEHVVDTDIQQNDPLE